MSNDGQWSISRLHEFAGWILWEQTHPEWGQRSDVHAWSFHCPQSILRAYPDLWIVTLMGQKSQRNWENYWIVQRDLIYINFCKTLLFEQGLILVPHGLLCDRKSKPSKSPGKATQDFVLITFLFVTTEATDQGEWGWVAEALFLATETVHGKHSADCLAPTRRTTNIHSLAPRVMLLFLWVHWIDFQLIHIFCLMMSKGTQLLLKEQ